MPEVILPCPASMNDAELLKLKHSFDDVCQSSTTPELFELCRAGSHLVDAIRAMPRALTWTHEPPKVAGWYPWRARKGQNMTMIQIHVFNDVCGFWDGNGVYIIDLTRGEWAGPIAPPVEG